MKTVSTTWSSSLPTQQIAGIFRATSERIFGSGFRRVLSRVPVPGGSTKIAFFTPKDSDSPFAQFEEKPTFSVGVQGPQGGGFNAALPVTVHMYVYENNGTRRVEFFAPYGGSSFKGRAIEHVRLFGQALSEADPQAKEIQRSG